MENAEQYLILFLEVMGALFALFGTSAMASKSGEFKIARNHAKERAMLERAKSIVMAAEEIFGSGRGADKMQYAIDRLGRVLSNPDDDTAKELISAALRELRHQTGDRSYGKNRNPNAQNSVN